MSDIEQQLHTIETCCKNIRDSVADPVVPLPDEPPVVDPDDDPHADNSIRIGNFNFPVVASDSGVAIVDTAAFLRNVEFGWWGNPEKRKLLPAAIFDNPTVVPLINMHQEIDESKIRAWCVTAYARFSHSFSAACFTWFYDHEWFCLFNAGRRMGTYGKCSTPFQLYSGQPECEEYGDYMLPPMSYVYGTLCGWPPPVQHQACIFPARFTSITIQCPANCVEREVSQGIVLFGKET